MSSPLITINHNEPISSAAERMTSKKIRKLAVTENGNIMGDSHFHRFSYTVDKITRMFLFS